MVKKKNSKKNKSVYALDEYIEEDAEPEEEIKIEIPEQFEFFKVPRRFGSIPVDKLPFGCDKDKQYYKEYPRISLPFQPVERISFGHPKLESNRLFFGDNLHVMRMLPSESIDLIYIDPPFFSGKQYNVIFGDQNEVRSFSDIWEGGMPGYIIWLNARLLEMKRLLKKTGSIYVHLDWHAGHYVKIEMDKIFGYDNFVNEIIWKYRTGGSSKRNFARKHDVILMYGKTNNYFLNLPKEKAYTKSKSRKAGVINYGAGFAEFFEDEKGVYNLVNMHDVWDIPYINSQARERIGYPTQKPEALLKRVIEASSNKGDVVADFFCGGGTTPAVAQQLGRRWIACDISKVAIAITLDRIMRILKTRKSGEKPKDVQHKIISTPDISVEYWGIYEVPSLTELKNKDFRKFVILAYNGRIATGDDIVHGYKQGIPLYVGSASQDKSVTKKEVIEFAKTIVKKKGKHQGTMLAWAFAPSAWKAAETLIAQKAIAVDFVKISLVPIESEEFKKHIVSKHKEYSNLLKFILPPEIRLNIKRLSPNIYEFDVSESVSLNSESKIINVQWDFDYKDTFISTPGYSFSGLKNKKPVLKVSYKFLSLGKKKIACRVQDDEGGEKIKITKLEVR